MKKFLKILASTVCIVSVILAGAENLDGSPNVKWTLFWLALAFLSGAYLNVTKAYERRR